MEIWDLKKVNQYLGLHDVSDVLRIGAKIVPKNHIERINNLRIYKTLYDGDRDILTSYYKNELVKYGVFKENNYNRMMIIDNYCKQSTRDLIWLSLASNPSITADKTGDNKKLQKFIKDKNLYKKLIEKIFINCHVSGNCFVHIIPTDGEFNNFQIFDTEQVFPITDEITGEIKAYIAMVLYKERGKRKGRYLVCEKGQDTVYDVSFSGGIISDIKEVGSISFNFNDFSMFNFVVNEDLSFPEYGISAYTDAVSLQSNIMKGLNTISVIQEKYASPILTGPDIPEAHTQDEEGEVLGTLNPNGEGGIIPGQLRNKMEMTGSYVANESEKDIKYVEFKGSTDIYNEFIKSTLEPAIIKSLGGMETLRQRAEFPEIDSSKALRLLYTQAINLAEGYCESIKGELEKMLPILAKLSKNSNVNVIFYPGIADFPEERAEYARNRMNDGTFSVIDAIMYEDNLSEEDAIKKYEKIREYNEKYPKNFKNGGDEI